MTTCNYFQIKTLRAHYDKMVSQDWQTGNQPYFEPLQTELTDCFTAITDVSGSTTYGSGVGINAPPRPIGSVEEGASGDASMEHEEETEPKKTKGTSILHIYFHLIYL